MKRICALLLAALAACAGLPAARAENIALTFAFWDAGQAPAMEAIARAYTGNHPGVDVIPRLLPWDAYWAALEDGLAGGPMPDVFWVHADSFQRYAQAGLLADLTDPTFDYSPYPSGLTAQYNLNGRQFAIPKDFDTVALAYNKRLFDEAGVPYPDDTWDWETFRQAAIRLTDAARGVYGFAAPNDTQSGYYNAVYQNGGFIFRDGRPGFDQRATQDAIQWWVDLQRKDGVSPDAASLAAMGKDEQFLAGRVAMVFAGSWMLGVYADDPDLAGQFDVAVLPRGLARASVYNGLGYAGAAASPYPDLAADFVRYCGGEQANLIQASYRAALPAYAGMEQAFVDAFPGLNAACFAQMLAYGVPLPAAPAAIPWQTAQAAEISAIYTGEKTVSQACDDLNARILQMLGE
ncbi:MAG: sugar ABC transporter substrate-binding protein [Oscillospiraceae bacterium]|jgi:multiple sugar transport system substrate-binding protein|nr:sugar ABC transporter substrate-binding protein [Oscillospiraceae bacterium]